MSRDSGRQASAVSRRKYLLTSAAIGTAGLAGCSGSDSGGTGSGSGGDEGSNSIESGSSGPSTVTAEGSSTVYPISNRGVPTGTRTRRRATASTGARTTSRRSPAGTRSRPTRTSPTTSRAYGFETTGERSNPPFATRVALSHSGTGCEAVRDGLVDIGNSSGPITAELDISEEQRDENYVDHVVGRDGQPVFVSQAIYDAGVEQLTGEQIRGIYQGDITNWSEVGGPDREIFVVGRAEDRVRTPRSD